MSTQSVILHVGPHKTGSTYLQYRLTRARPELAEYGIAYPDVGFAVFGHHGLVDHLRSERGFGAEAVTPKAIVAAAEAQTTTVLSSENFVFLRLEHLRKLKELLPHHRFEVVFFIRRMSDIWPSHWQEVIKHGSDLTFLEYLGVIAGWQRGFDRLQVDAAFQLGKFAEVFGRESLRIICYDNVLAERGDIFVFFWQQVLGLDAPRTDTDQERMNLSLPPWNIDVLRNLNELYMARTGGRVGSIIRSHFQHSKRMHEDSGLLEEYREQFKRHARYAELKPDLPWLRLGEQEILQRFGEQMMNAASRTRLFTDEGSPRSVMYGPRNWIFRAKLDTALESIVGDFLAGQEAAPGGGETATVA